MIHFRSRGQDRHLDLRADQPLPVRPVQGGMRKVLQCRAGLCARRAQKPRRVELRSAQGADGNRGIPPESHILRKRGRYSVARSSCQLKSPTVFHLILLTNSSSGGPLACDGFESTTQQGVQGFHRGCHGLKLGRKIAKTGTPAIAINYCLTM